MTNDMTKEQVRERLLNNEALFNLMFVFQQHFDIVPSSDQHIGASIAYQDIRELRTEFLEALVDTIVDWIYDAKKFEQLKETYKLTGKSDGAASAAVIRKAKSKFRRSNDNLLIQGQLGELLLFHFIQKVKEAVPLLRKMNITTSSSHERYGADAIHYKVEDHKNVIILGEAKAYTLKYKFAKAFEKALESILETYNNLSDELNLYVHEDFLDDELNSVAEAYLTNTLENVRVELVAVIVYNETTAIRLTDEDGIKEQILSVIERKYRDFDNEKIDVVHNQILSRITYIVFPIWELDKFAQEFQDKMK